MKFSYNWLKALYPSVRSPEEAVELLTFHAFQVETLEKIGDDTRLDIAILPNRIADASGHIGVAREIAAASAKEFKLLSPQFREDTRTGARDLLKVSIKAKNASARYSARVLAGVKIGPSPAWMQARLKVCGLRPINVVVDVTNYVMLETGQPLHAFDYDRLRGGKGAKKEIIVRFAEKGEMVETLGDDAEKIKLEPSDIVIADKNGPIALAGIKGGKGSEIQAGTTQIVLESANFDNVLIRRASRRIGLKTDASVRFEHNVSPELTLEALDRAAALLQKLAGAKVCKGVADVYPKKQPAISIPFSITRASSLLGVKISQKETLDILRRLGCIAEKRSEEILRVTPPPFRRDLAIEEDLIEEVGRIKGYEKIAPAMPVLRGGVPKKSERRVFEEALKDRLAGFGFSESHLPSFIGERALAVFGIKPDGLYALQNPTSPESAYLLHLPALRFLSSIAENLRHFDKVKIFGVSRGFLKTAKGPREWRSLFLGLAERGRDGKEEFYALKGVLDSLLESFGVSDYWYDNASLENIKWAHPYRAASIKLGDKSLGVMGELSHQIQEALKSKTRIVMAEFDVDALLGAIETEQEFRPIAKFPAIVRDIAFLVPQEARIQEVENILWDASPKFLADTDFFDYYEGEGLPEGKKSVAFRLVFQSEERTLTDEEVNKEFAKVTKALKARGWEVRE